MAKTFNVHEAKTHLSALLDEVQGGTEIILAKAGKPYAKLVPVRAGNKRPLGFVPGHLDESFFEPLPPEEMAPWESEAAAISKAAQKGSDARRQGDKEYALRYIDQRSTAADGAGGPFSE